MCIKTKIFFIFFLILSFIFSVKTTFAVNYFSDNFDQDNLNNWILVDINAGQESWKIIDDKLVGEITIGESSFLLAKDFWDLSDYSIRLDLINEGGVDQNIAFRVSEDRSKYYLLNLRFKDPYWPQDGGEIVLWKYDSGYKKLATFNDLSQINLTQNQIHSIKIEVNNSKIKTYFDSVSIINIEDDDPILKGSFGFYNWGGNYYERPTKSLFDNLIVGDFDYEPTPTPTTPIPTSTPTSTPTPTLTLTPTPKVKIIILPGLGASWNL